MLEPALISDVLRARFASEEDLALAHGAVDSVLDSHEPDRTALVAVFPLLLVATRALEFGTPDPERSDETRFNDMIADIEIMLDDYVPFLAARAEESGREFVKGFLSHIYMFCDVVTDAISRRVDLPGPIVTDRIRRQLMEEMAEAAGKN